MEQSKKPLWKKSILKDLYYNSVVEWLYEIGNNGDMYGYDSDDSGYYQDYKELFDDLSYGAYRLQEALEEYDMREHWDDMTVALLGELKTVFGYDADEYDYFRMMSWDEDYAVEQAQKKLMGMTKVELIRCFRNVLTTLCLFWDLKTAHDCLTAVVEELDNRGALLDEKNNQINRLYEDLTGKNGETFDELVRRIPPRMWIE